MMGGLRPLLETPACVTTPQWKPLTFSQGSGAFQAPRIGSHHEETASMVSSNGSHTGVASKAR